MKKRVVFFLKLLACLKKNISIFASIITILSFVYNLVYNIIYENDRNIQDVSFHLGNIMPALYSS